MHACARGILSCNGTVPPCSEGTNDFLALCLLQLKMFLPMGIMWGYNKVRCHGFAKLNVLVWCAVRAVCIIGQHWSAVKSAPPRR